MPKLDEAKERLGLLKFWLGIFVATFLGVASWILSHLKDFSDDTALIVFAFIFEILLLFLILNANNKAKKILEEIRKLKK